MDVEKVKEQEEGLALLFPQPVGGPQPDGGDTAASRSSTLLVCLSYPYAPR